MFVNSRVRFLICDTSVFLGIHTDILSFGDDHIGVLNDLADCADSSVDPRAE